MPIRFEENKASQSRDGIPVFSMDWIMLTFTHRARATPILADKYGTRVVDLAPANHWAMQYRVDPRDIERYRGQNQYWSHTANDVVWYIQDHCPIWKEVTAQAYRQLIGMVLSFDRIGKPEVPTELPSMDALSDMLYARIKNRVEYSLEHWNDAPMRRTGKQR